MDFQRMASDRDGQKVSDEVMKLLMTDSYKDIRIIANDGEIEANKIILCARSVYFDQMFSNKNFIECDSGEVRFDCDKIIMERVIKYLYHGFEGIVEDLSMKQLLDLLRISMMMLLTELNREAKGALDNLMAHKVKPEILIESAIHAEYMKMEDILTSLLTKIFKNLRKCSQSPDFSMLSCNSIEILFNLKLKKKRTSYVRFQAFLKWYENTTNQMCCTQDFIKGIISTFDMSTFTCDQILDEVRKSGFFTSDEIFIMLGNLIKEKDKAYEAKFNSLSQKNLSLSQRILKLEKCMFPDYRRLRLLLDSECSA